jgi:hypothetical protein
MGCKEIHAIVNEWNPGWQGEWIFKYIHELAGRKETI